MAAAWARRSGGSLVEVGEVEGESEGLRLRL